MRLTRNAKVGQTPAQRAPVTPRSARRRGRTPGLNLGVAGAAASFAGTRRPPSAGAARRSAGAARRPPSATSTRRAVVTPRRLTRPAETAKSFGELYAAEMGATAPVVREGWRDQASPERCAIPAAQPISTTYEKPPATPPRPKLRVRLPSGAAPPPPPSLNVTFGKAVASPNVMLSPPMSPAGRAALDEGLSPHPNKYCETVRERNLDRDRVPRPLSRSWRRARPLTPAAARAFRRQRDCEDAAALEGYRRERGTIERLAREAARQNVLVEPFADAEALRRAPAEVAGPTLCVSLPGGSACRVSGPRFDAHTCAVVLHALEWHRHLRGAQDPDAALRDALRRAQCGASVLDAARARLAAANAREHELRPRGPKRPKTKKKGSSAGGARAGWRVARRAARSAARAVADLENRLNAVLLDERGEPSARFRVGATSVVVRLVRAMTPDPRPAGALFRGLANEATSPRGAPRKDLPPHALGRAGPLTHTG